MGKITVRGQEFTIAGDEPTTDEQQRIAAIVKGGGQKDGDTEGGFWGWLGTRAKNAAASVVGMPRDIADINEAATREALKKLGMDPKLAERIGLGARFLTPGGGLLTTPSSGEVKTEIDKSLDRTFGGGGGDVNAPESWGWKGKAVDAAAEAVLGSIPFVGAGL